MCETKNIFLSLVVRSTKDSDNALKVFSWRGAWESEIVLLGELCTVSSKLVVKTPPANTET